MKLFVSDLDGTLFDEGTLDQDRQCSKKNIEAVQRWVHSGNRFAVATARPVHIRKMLEQQLKIQIDMIGGNGIELLFVDGTHEFYGTSAKSFFDIAEWILQNQINATAAMKMKGKWIVSGIDRFPFTDVKRYRTFLSEGIVLNRKEADPDELCSYLGVFVEPDAMSQVKEELKLLFGKTLEFVSSDIDDIDILPKGISKGKGVCLLAQSLNLCLSDVIVAGDSENDISMFEAVECSYCMKGAEKKVQMKAKMIAESVAEAIDKEIKKETDHV